MLSYLVFSVASLAALAVNISDDAQSLVQIKARPKKHAPSVYFQKVAEIINARAEDEGWSARAYEANYVKLQEKLIHNIPLLDKLIDADSHAVEHAELHDDSLGADTSYSIGATYCPKPYELHFEDGKKTVACVAVSQYKTSTYYDWWSDLCYPDSRRNAGCSPMMNCYSEACECGIRNFDPEWKQHVVNADTNKLTRSQIGAMEIDKWCTADELPWGQEKWNKEDCTNTCGGAWVAGFPQPVKEIRPIGCLRASHLAGNEAFQAYRFTTSMSPQAGERQLTCCEGHTEAGDYQCSSGIYSKLEDTGVSVLNFLKS